MTRGGLAVAAALGTAALLLLAGCSRPPGIDGSLVDDWAPLPQAKAWQPVGHACYGDGFVQTPSVLAARPIDCAEQHRLETIHVGAFPERPTPPPAGSPERRAAYQDCLTRATEFLGDDWRAGRLWLAVAVPTESAWSGGARWYRCDLREVTDQEEDDGRLRTAGLQDALRGARPLAITCYQSTIKNDEIETMVPADCAKPHDTEFAGVYLAPDVTYPKSEQDRDDLGFTGCRAVVARYVNVPNDTNFYRRLGLIVTWFSEEEWAQGNRGFRCHLWLEKSTTRSMRGAGTGALPVS